MLTLIEIKNLSILYLIYKVQKINLKNLFKKI